MDFDKGLYTKKNEAYYFQERSEMLEYVPHQVKSVLEVGCSSGGFGKLLKEKRGCEVWGIEPSDSALIAKEHLDKVFHDIFHSTLDLEGKKFDVIIFNDVLEHLTNPWEALALARNYLSADGSIVASIPNVQCYTVVKKLILNGDWKYESSGILDKTHYRFFTKKSIGRLFQECGYEIEVMNGQNSILGGSRLLRFLHFFFPKRVDPFIYVNYALRAKLKH